MATGEQSNLMLEESDATGPNNAVKNGRGGPPNRMNDLVYRDWMKFQKSFFRYASDQSLVDECIYFFTKAVWDDQTPSRTLIVGADAFSSANIPSPRQVTHVNGPASFESATSALRQHTNKTGLQDFVLVDFRPLIKDGTDLDTFIMNHADSFFEALRASLKKDRYCCVIVDNPQTGAGGFPLPWPVALAARTHLRLRDEKIGLVENQGRVFYCLFMQANGDTRPTALVTQDNLRLSPSELWATTVPAWIIPKPPPRKKNEILHPAKFPETLIEEFIRLFSKERDNVFDPMVGTGSAIVAALRTKRNGFGTDLSEEFVRTAQERIQDEQKPSLFPDFLPEGHVFLGDATKLDQIHGLDDIQFQYSVTSPPYWSMLTNPGSENQEARRRRNLPLVYSQRTQDLGNIADYDRFLDALETVYGHVAERLTHEGILTVIVKNVKREHILYPLAWDLALRLCGPTGPFDYIGTTLWCQDDVGIKPFAVGIYWVSNILHTYCLHFQKRDIPKNRRKK
jgi:hypothetical protein